MERKWSQLLIIFLKKSLVQLLQGVDWVGVDKNVLVEEVYASRVSLCIFVEGKNGFFWHRSLWKVPRNTGDNSFPRWWSASKPEDL